MEGETERRNITERADGGKDLEIDRGKEIGRRGREKMN